MASSERRRKEQQAKTARKKSSMVLAGGNSVYALKKRGTYPANSPYLTGNWGVRMANLSDTKEASQVDLTPGPAWDWLRMPSSF